MRVNCVGAIVRDGEGRTLLIRRGRPPGRGLWSLPGGRIEPGESDAEAVALGAPAGVALAVRHTFTRALEIGTSTGHRVCGSHGRSRRPAAG